MIKAKDIFIILISFFFFYDPVSSHTFCPLIILSSFNLLKLSFYSINFILFLSLFSSLCLIPYRNIFIRVELIVSLFSRVVDIHNFDTVLQVLTPKEVGCLYARIGWYVTLLTGWCVCKYHFFFLNSFLFCEYIVNWLFFNLYYFDLPFC